MLLYVDVFNEFHNNNSDNGCRLFNVNDKDDVISLLTEPYCFSVSYVCEKVTNTINEWSANFLYHKGGGEDVLHVVPIQTLISMLQGSMDDIVKDVLRYNSNEVYQRFYNSEIFGLIYDND